MTLKVKLNVYVLKDGISVLLRPGDTVPDGVTVTNPAVIDADSVEESPAEDVKDEDTEDESDKDESPEDESPEEPAEAPEPAPAPRKRAARKAAPASE